MFARKRKVSIILCVTMILCAIMPHFALDEETNQGMIVEQTSIENNTDKETSIEATNEPKDESSTTEPIIETTIKFVDESTIKSTDETTAETTVETMTNITTENANETSTETTAETTIETSTEITTTTIKTEKNLSLIIEESTTSETTFVEKENDIAKNEIATNSEIKNNDKENIDNVLSQVDDSKKSNKKNLDNTKKYKNSAKPAGFTVDIVNREGNGLFGSNPNIPDRYDSREHQNTHGVDIIPPPRDQNPFGTCWAFASIGMIETSIRSKNLVTSPDGDGSDLSEAALALFAIEGLEGVTDNSNYIDKPGVEGADFNCINYDYYMNVEHIPRASMSFADSGGSEPNALLMLSTYMGAVSENDFPYTEANIKAIINELHTTGLANSRKPYAFNRNRYEVINVEFLNKNDRDSVKEAIMKYGSVGIGYNENRNDDNCHVHDGEWYYLSPDKTYKILDDGSIGEERDLWSNHAVMVVGWDDNIGFNEFFYDGEIYEDRGDYVIASYSIIDDDSGKYYPTYKTEESRAGLDGAWLIRNSWGDDNDKANHGYFWLPYDDLNLDTVMCVVDADKAGKYKYNYHYDTTLTTDTYNYHGLGKLANIFKVSSDEDQVLEAVNIAWKSANIDYEIQIYTNDNQMSNPEDGDLKLTQSVHNGSSGIKTIELDNSIRVNKNTYFSIIVKANTAETEIFYDCTHAEADSDKFSYNEVHLGESWENDSGTWQDINTSPAITTGDKIYGYTPRIRGLTNPAPAPTPPPTPTPSPIPSGGDSGGGGGSSGGPIIPNDQTPQTTVVSSVKESYPAIDASQATWVYDPQTNKFKLNVDVNGQKVPALNGFFTINEVDTVNVNNILVPVSVQNTYYLNASGEMLTGFVKTSDGKTYFFENAKTKDEGKMVVGWKKIQNDWYYFDVDGRMFTNSFTPDGYYVGEDGKFKK